MGCCCWVFFFVLVLETGSHEAQAGFELIMYQRVIFEVFIFLHLLLSAEIMGMSQHVWP